jgi:hypothetical protein
MSHVSLLLFPSSFPQNLIVRWPVLDIISFEFLFFQVRLEILAQARSRLCIDELVSDSNSKLVTEEPDQTKNQGVRNFASLL